MEVPQIIFQEYKNMETTINTGTAVKQPFDIVSILLKRQQAVCFTCLFWALITQ